MQNDHNLVSEIERLVIQGEIGGTDVPAAVVPADSVLVSLERFMDHPRSLKASYSTSDLDSFIKYCNQEMTDESAIFIDKKRAVAECRIDIGDKVNPGWGSHNAFLELNKTDEFTALCGIKGETSADVFIEFIEDWMHLFSFYQGDLAINPAHVIQALRSLKVDSSKKESYKTESLSESKSTMDSIAADAESGSIPEYFFFSCGIYEHTKIIGIKCQIKIVLREGHKPMIKTRFIGYQSLHNEVLDDFEKKLSGAIQHNERVYMGTVELNY